MQDTVTTDDTDGIDPRTPIRVGEHIKTDEPVHLPVEEVLTGRAFLTGKSGSGKSNSANVIAEQILERGLALLIIDTEGEYYSLKEEYEVLHVGADPDCDLQIASEHGEKLAELALEDNVPIILDVSDYFDEDERNAVIYETVSSLFHQEKRHKKPFLIIAEEAHEYIPQQGARTDLSKMMVRVGKRGRKRGLGLLAASQRPQDVDKQYISQCDWILWHRLTWDSDTKVVRRVANSETANAVENLDDGEGFLQADFVEEDIVRSQVDRMQTFDAGATPGLEGFDEPELKSVSEGLVDELEDISEREGKRQDRIEELESQLADREERITELENRVERLKDLREMVDSTDGLPDAADGREANTEKATPSEMTLEIDGDTFHQPETIKAQVLEIQQEKADAEEELERVRRERDELAETIEQQQAELTELREQVEQLDWIAGHFDELEEATRRLADVIGLEVGSSEEQAEKRLSEKDHRIEQLKQERDELAQRVEELSPSGDTADDRGQEPVVSTPDSELNTYLAADVIKDEFTVVVEEGNHAAKHYPNHLALVAQSGEGVTPQQAADLLGVSDTLSRTVLRELRGSGFLRAEGSRPETFYVDRDRIERRVAIAEQTE